MTVPTVSGLARQYIAGFSGDDFVPKTLDDAGLLSDEGKKLMASIPAANLATEVQAMKSGFLLDQQKSINETELAIQELKNEQAKKKMIVDQLGGTSMAGSALSAFLGGGGGSFDLQGAINSAQIPSKKTSPAGMESLDLNSLANEYGVSADQVKAMIEERLSTKKG